MPDDCLIYLVRHGATAHNLLDPPRMQGRHIDEPLTDSGQSQAAQVAAALAGKSLAAIYSSPLKRSMQTAEAIAKHHEMPVTAVEDLAEADVGKWEDRSWVDIEANDNAAYLAFREDPVANGYPGGENLRQVTDRVVAALNQVAANHLGQHIAVSAHSVVNRLYLGELLHVPIAMRRRLPQDNCNLNIIRWRAHKQSVITVNALDHLAR
ncbi:histidine phosphatase family protein [Aeoliella sp. ICT_H6.2]|uniref:Histidine phosphatase family protein n=1 Tax=Aeoliella straminimaris TaxID=2954799 RepID=A0A9X2FJQ8_9BACT|nr:histidine phosphatase family protein [Aeoliella straminimaris]MCO6047716.1 histidine phosphatase family protein [Aeoliella straminimaris]